MTERRERLIEILKALAFVLVGFFGGIAAAGFIEGFKDGYQRGEAEHAAAASGESEARP